MKKNIRRWLTPIALAGVLPVLSGCAALSGVKEEKPRTHQAVASKIGAELLVSFLKDDAAAFIRLLPGDAAQNFTDKDFKKTRESMTKELGTPVSYAFVTNLENPIANISVWRIRFERKSADNTKVITQEVLFKALSTKKEPEMLVGFNFL